MKNKLIIFIILVLVLFPSSGLVLDVSHPSSASPNVVGSADSEEENIDSMDVFPSNRWSVTNNGFTAEVSDGLLNMSDVGDGTDDFFQINRDLRDLDGKIEIRFKVTVNASSGNFQDSFYIKLLGSPIDFEASLLVETLQNNAHASTRLRMTKAAGGVTDKVLSGNERVFEDLWYVLRIDYDLLKSECRFRLFFDNNSKVFDIDYFDIDPVNRFGIFAQTGLVLRIQSRSIGVTVINFVDYILAPFKEREWIRQATSGDADWLESSYAINRVQDDIPDDEEFWNLVSPFFDSVTGHMILQTDAVLNPGAAGEDIEVKFFVNGVDFDDGALHPLFGVIARIRSAAGGGATGIVEVFDAVRGVRTIRDIQPAVDTVKIDVDFSVTALNDREELIWKVSAFFNGDTTDITLASGHIPARTTFVDIRDEFVLQTDYIMDFDDNIEVIAGFTDISILERDIFSDIGGFLDDVIGFGEDVVSGGADLFGVLFRWLGALLVGALVVLGEVFEAAISILQSALTAALGLVEDAVGLVEDAIDALGLILDDIVAALGELAQDIIDAVVATMDDIIDAAITQLLAVASDVADFLFAAIEFLVVLLLDFLSELWSLMEGIIFFIWDAIGLPNIIEFFDLLSTTIFDTMTAAPGILLDIVSWIELFAVFVLIIWWFWAFFLSFAEHDFNPFEGMSSFIEKCFTNLLPFSLLGFEIYVPQALAIIPLTVFLIFVDSGFNIW